MNVNQVLTLPLTTIDQQPSGNWRLPSLVKPSMRGLPRVWIIAYIDGVLYTYGADLDKRPALVSMRQQSATTVTTRSMATPGAQAMVDARRKWNEKSRKGWAVLPDTLEMPTNMHREPMLAQTFKASRIKYWPVSMQPKLDGFRVLTYGPNALVTRSGSTYHFLDHVRAELQLLYRYLPRDTVLDGELYVHGVSRNVFSTYIRVANSNVQLTKPEDEHRVAMYIFDRCDQTCNHLDRYATIARAHLRACCRHGQLQYIRLLNPERAYSIADIDHYYRTCLSQGYEGVIIRILITASQQRVQVVPLRHLQQHQGYVHGRTVTMMKLKNRLRCEATVVNVFESSSGSERERGAAMFEVQFGNVRTKVRPAATYEDRHRWLQDPALVVGRTITIEYEGVNDDTGMPQQPTMVDFRDNHV